MLLSREDFFLHAGLSPGATRGRAVVIATVKMINGFSQAEMKVLGTNVNLSPFSPLQMRVLIRK